jgi:uncharacterized surface protein with fasciclin (FAS1) repeats
MRIRSLAVGIALMAGVVTAAGAQQATAERTTSSQDIITVLRNAGTFRMFLNVVNAAGYTRVLKGSGPYTVFAPTDDAFSRIPAVVRDSLLRDKASMEVLIQNHVVQGKLSSVQAKKGTSGMSFMGGAGVKVDTSDNRVRVNGAQVIKCDMVASNGVIHVVDRVWMPTMSYRVRGTTPEDSAAREHSTYRP